MKKFIAISVAVLLLFASTTDCFARGGYSSGGGRGGFSGGRSYSGSFSSRSYAAPRPTYNGNRHYSSTRTYNGTTHITRIYGGGYVHPGMMYGGGWGMGYGYSNGLITGMIIGDMMHPQGTTVYNGGGYGGQALLYPNGAVVDSTGHQVGTYINGQFIAVQNGAMMAQPVPQDAVQQPQPTEDDTTVLDALGTAIGIIILLVILFFLVVLIIGA